jgi:3'(2'), 5'-bisphosphate nucleotidase
MLNINQIINSLLLAIVSAGEEILKIYNFIDFDIQLKSDNSPLTQADLASHKTLISYLNNTGIPIISEEGNIPGFEERKNYKQYWLIDPLDGTKEFIKRNGEFTVNVALIENDKPIFGVVYAPVLGDLYFGGQILGAFKFKVNSIDGNTINQSINQSPSGQLTNHLIHSSIPTKKLIVVASRSHNNQETEDYIHTISKSFESVEIISKGSSLKLCEVAEGKAHVYPRFGPTMEWDTAAAHAIVEAAGGYINQPNGEPLMYNKENLLNPFFIVKSF